MRSTYFILGLFLIHICAGFQELGCFYDYLTNRTLPGLNACNLPEAEGMCNECTSEHPYCENTQSMTVFFCTDLCHRRGFLFSGLEAGNQCFCGNNFDPLNPPNGKPPNNDNCTEPCPGDSSQFCGGELRIIIYRNENFTNCSTPIDFSNGTVTPKQDVYASGTTVNFACNEGFYQVGPTDSYCWYSGQFSHVTKDVQPKCIRECTALNSDSITEVRRMVEYPGFFVVGDTITYKCSEGYEADSGVSEGDLECREDRLWAENLPICNGVSCGDPGTPNQGEIFGDRFYYPHVVSYMCQTGYTIVGSTTRMCQSDKAWSGTLPSCNPNDCGNLDNIENGMTSYTGTTFGMNATYTCNIGFNVNGEMIRTCEENGLWSGSPPTCEVVSCGDPGSLLNGVRMGTDETYGSTVTYGCNTGYNMLGAASATCQSDGTWSESAPVCQIVDCGIVSVGEGVFKNGVTFTYNAVLMFICDTGYSKVSGNTTRTCQADGNWSGNDLVCEIVNCGDPGTPTFGRKIGSNETYGSTVNYVCNTGYNLVGSANVTCQSNGTWSDSPPTCQLVNCGNPGTPTDGVKHGSDQTYGSTVNYVCNTGYNLVGTAMITCQSDGAWSDSAPSCQIVDCMHPGSPLGVTVKVNETTYGAIVTYNCPPGYSISSGNNWRACSADGSWSGIQPTCSVNSCGEPPNPEFSIRTGADYDVGGIVDYACMAGYERTAGDPSITCTIDGTWSGETIVCSAVNCEDPGTPQNGFQTATDLTYQGSVSFECNTGYNLVGTASITCQSDKTWSDSVPTCQKLTTIQQTTVQRTTAERIITTLNPTTTQQRTTQLPTTKGKQQTTEEILTTKLTLNPTTTQQRTTQLPTTIGKQQTTEEILTTKLIGGWCTSCTSSNIALNPITQQPITTGKQQTTVGILTTNLNSPTVRHTTAAIKTSENQQTTYIVPTKGGVNEPLTDTGGISDYLLYIVGCIVVLLVLILILGATYILSSRRKNREALTKSASIEAIPNPAYVDGFAETPNAATNEGFEMAEENEVKPESPTSNGSVPIESGNDATDGWTPIGHLESETSGGKFKPTFMAK